MTTEVYKAKASLDVGAPIVMNPLSEYGMRLMSSDGRFIVSAVAQSLACVITWGISFSPPL
jgi:hypothetical protein